MASLIKNQILKQLSKFTKGLSPDKIQVSTLKGEGELSNLELDEHVLMDVLDLPTWLKITRASCNRVAIKYLDEIEVEMETCERPRMPTVSSYNLAGQTAGKYGFAERIIDGMYVSINSVMVNFKSRAFLASIQVSRIVVQSKTPLWQNGDLRLTRIKDDSQGEVLLFKEAEWQTLRIEADALHDGVDGVRPTPLRLIANQSKIRLTFKKRLSDCAIVATRLRFNLDDLLWVLTDSQLHAAVIFVNSLKDVIKKSALQTKKFAADKLKKQQSSTAASPPAMTSPARGAAGAQRNQTMGQLFARYNILETSYHVFTGRIDLHLCDDATDQGYKRRVEGGALQITLHKLDFDYYPYHLAGDDRSKWLRYDDNMRSRMNWAHELLEEFKENVRRVRDVMKTPPTTPVQNTRKVPAATAPTVSKATKKVEWDGDFQELLESCYIIRLEDFAVFQVTSSVDSRRRHAGSPPKLLSSGNCLSRDFVKQFAVIDKRQHLLPPEMSSVHVELTDYYFPDGINYPIPCSNLYVMVNPVKLHLDFLTLLWLNSFMLSLLHSADLSVNTEPVAHTDIRVDALMPKVTLSVETPTDNSHPQRPDSVSLLLSKACFTNVRQNGDKSRDVLGHLMRNFHHASLFSESPTFPRISGDLQSLAPVFSSHATCNDHSYMDDSVDAILTGKSLPVRSPAILESQGSDNSYYNMTTDSMKQDAAKDVWVLKVDQLWLEFGGVRAARGRPAPFVESFPVTLWFHKVEYPLLTNGHSDQGQHAKKAVQRTDNHLLVTIDGKVNAQISHYQFLFLMRLIEHVTRSMTELQVDTSSILLDETPIVRTTVALQLREAQVALVLPAPQGHLEDSASMHQLDCAGASSAQCTEFDSALGSNEESPECGGAAAQHVRADVAHEQPPNHVQQPQMYYPESPSLLIDSPVNNTDAPLASEYSPAFSDWPKAAQPPPEVKKSMSNAFSSLGKFGSKLTEKMKLLDPSESGYDDDWETLSAHSGESEDEEMLLMGLTNGHEAPAFERRRAPDQESSSATSESEVGVESGATDQLMPRKVTVSIFRVKGVHGHVQLLPDDLAAAITIRNLEPRDMGVVATDAFQQEFSTGPDNGTADMQFEDDTIIEGPEIIRVRFESGESAAKHGEAPGDRGYLTVEVERLKTELSMTTLTNALSLIEDEVVNPGMPLSCVVADSFITLKNDTPPVFPNSPPAQPLPVSISSVSARRDGNGVFIISTLNTESRTAPSAGSLHCARGCCVLRDLPCPEEFRSRCVKLEDENQHLRMQLEQLTQQQQQQGVLRESRRSRSREERYPRSATERSRCEVDDELVALRAERESMLKTLQSLQEELDLSERHRRPEQRSNCQRAAPGLHQSDRY